MLGIFFVLFLGYGQAIAGFMTDGGISKDEFKRINSTLEDFYSPVFRSNNLRLKIVSDWESNTNNAYATHRHILKRRRIVSMLGGLARNAAMSADSHAFVVCHEMGHHIGGAPYKGRRWASAEGQSDYFAAKTCLKRYFSHFWNSNAGVVRNFMRENHNITVEVETATRLCDQKYRDEEESAICVRIMIAGYRFTRAVKPNAGASMSLSSTLQPSTTNTDHPTAQCRLDTVRAGALNEERPRCWYVAR